MDYAGRSVVEDEKGTRYQVYEFRGRRLFRGTIRRFELETGARLDRVDSDTFRLPATGETLLVVRY